MEYIVFALTVLVFLLLIMAKGIWDEKRKKAEFIRWLHENYGALPRQTAQTVEDTSRIAGYFKKHGKEDFWIDDITWNDLNMDAVFRQMNYAYSAAGEEYLYYLLRSPRQKVGELKRMEEHIRIFMENKESRIQYQIFFAEAGKTGKYSIYDYLDHLELLGERKNTTHYLGNLLLLASIVLMFASVPVGVTLLLTVICWNIITYFRVKGEIEPYIISFSYILRLLRSAKRMSKLPMEGFEEEFEELKNCLKRMNKFQAGSYIIMSPGRMNASNNPIELLLDYIRMTFHLDLIKFNNMLAEVRKNKEIIDRLLSLSGYMEAVIAIGAYRASLSSYCLPELTEERTLRMENVYHPLIEHPVKNSIDTERGVLLTGSNASGKSTFLRTVAINAILAQTIHTCLADYYRGTLCRVLSSMALKDDLAGGDSYYIVEIKSLKRILNQAAEQGCQILCFVDEVLRGTNTVERIAASTQILKSLSKDNVICFAATHDIELTYLLEEKYNNFHFEEEIREDDVVFNYRLMEGRATTRNAIKLLRVMGYEENIILDAEGLAEHFLQSGVWTK